jgi:DNA-binding transcriptional LysR family regulator
MDLMRALRVFQAVVRHHSFAAGARELGLSTTSVSRIVIELEDELGARLLNRTTRTLNVTEAGLLLYNRTREILVDIDDVKGSINTLSHVVQGTLRVTCPVSFGVRVLMPLMPSFFAAYPKVSVEVSLTNRYVDLIEEGFDVAIRQGHEMPSTLIVRRLGSFTSMLCASPEYLNRYGHPNGPQDINRHSNVIYRSSHRTDDLYVFKESEGLETSVKAKGTLLVDSTDAMREAVLSGCGIGLFPSYSVADDLASRRLVAIFPQLQMERADTFVLYPHRRHLSNRVRAFVDFLIGRIQLQ